MRERKKKKKKKKKKKGGVPRPRLGRWSEDGQTLVEGTIF